MKQTYEYYGHIINNYIFNKRFHKSLHIFLTHSKVNWHGQLMTNWQQSIPQTSTYIPYTFQCKTDILHLFNGQTNWQQVYERDQNQNQCIYK